MNITEGSTLDTNPLCQPFGSPRLKICIMVRMIGDGIMSKYAIYRFEYVSIQKLGWLNF